MGLGGKEREPPGYSAALHQCLPMKDPYITWTPATPHSRQSSDRSGSAFLQGKNTLCCHNFRLFKQKGFSTEKQPSVPHCLHHCTLSLINTNTFQKTRVFACLKGTFIPCSSKTPPGYFHPHREQTSNPLMQQKVFLAGFCICYKHLV